MSLALPKLMIPKINDIFCITLASAEFSLSDLKEELLRRISFTIMVVLAYKDYW